MASVAPTTLSHVVKPAVFLPANIAGALASPGGAEGLAAQLGVVRRAHALDPEGTASTLAATLGPTYAAQLGSLASSLAPLAAGIAPALGGLATSMGSSLAVTPSGTLGTLAPTQAAALNTLAAQQAQVPVQEHEALVARSQIRHVTGALDPQLSEISKMLRQQDLQTRATAEHKRIMQQRQFQRTVLGRLAHIDRYIPRY